MINRNIFTSEFYDHSSWNFGSNGSLSLLEAHIHRVVRGDWSGDADNARSERQTGNRGGTH